VALPERLTICRAAVAVVGGVPVGSNSRPRSHRQPRYGPGVSALALELDVGARKVVIEFPRTASPRAPTSSSRARA